MATSYGIVTGDGTVDHGGFSQLVEARAAAQALANKRDETVEIYDASSSEEPRPTVETVEPASADEEVR